jgi:flavin-dependent dehydrogenase
LYVNTKLIGSRPSDQKRWRLTVRGEGGVENYIEAAFVVDATGRRAAFASQQNIRKVFLDRLLGIYAFFSLNARAPLSETYALVEAWEEGWWYSALVPDGKLAVVCMSDADIVKRRGLHSSVAWFELLSETRHVKARLQEAELLNAPTVHAASSQRLERMTGRSWLAVGDAATTFDPLSSQGVCQGLRSGIMASYAIGDYFKGSATSLDKYEAILTREFEGYLMTRADYYSRERRFEHSPFWQRRSDQITLDPRRVLSLSETARKAATVDRLSMHLPLEELKHLCHICHVPRQAQEIVSEFKARSSRTPDRRVILALQYLLEEGVITSAAT